MLAVLLILLLTKRYHGNVYRDRTRPALQYKRHPSSLSRVFIAMLPRVSPRLSSGTTSGGPPEDVYINGVLDTFSKCVQLYVGI